MYKDKADQLACQRRHYKNNKRSYLDRNNVKRDILRKWFVELKSSLVCSRCPENHPACLDFHHTNPKTKVASVARMVASCFTKKRILAEIAKCIVLCSNCHRKIHSGL